jgi:hypothetical protein
MEGWTKYIDEPTKKVYYKYEEGYKYMTQYMEVFVDAGFFDVFNLFNEV